jgi:hypothetical protein
MTEKQITHITTEQMTELLKNETGMSPATRQAIITGACTYDDGSGNVYKAPPTFEGDGPTHQLLAVVNPVTSFGKQPGDLN